MRIAGLVVGVVGAIWEFFGFLFLMFVLVTDQSFDSKAETVGALAMFGHPIVGLVGAVLSVVKPRLAAGLMLVSSVTFFVSVVMIFADFLPMPLIIAPAFAAPLVIGAALAFLGRNQNQNR